MPFTGHGGIFSATPSISRQKITSVYSSDGSTPPQSRPSMTDSSLSSGGLQNVWVGVGAWSFVAYSAGVMPSPPSSTPVSPNGPPGLWSAPAVSVALTTFLPFPQSLRGGKYGRPSMNITGPHCLSIISRTSVNLFSPRPPLLGVLTTLIPGHVRSP